MMRKLLATTASAAFILGAADAVAAELPTFEIMGFPVTQLQVAILGGAHVREHSATSALTLGGMPASPHQVSVLTPRPKVVQQEVAPSLLKAGLRAVGTTNIQ